MSNDNNNSSKMDYLNFTIPLRPKTHPSNKFTPPTSISNPYNKPSPSPSRMSSSNNRNIFNNFNNSRSQSNSNSNSNSFGLSNPYNNSQPYNHLSNNNSQSHKYNQLNKSFYNNHNNNNNNYNNHNNNNRQNEYQYNRNSNLVNSTRFTVSKKANNGFTTDSKLQENYDINIKDIQKIHNEKLINKLKYYEKILQKCFFKIRQSVYNEETYCLYSVPSYMKGFPIYNVKQCIFYIMNKLKKNSIESKYIYPNIIFIYWKYKNTYDQIKDLQNKQIRNKETGQIEYKPSYGANSYTYKKPFTPPIYKRIDYSN